MDLAGNIKHKSPAATRTEVEPTNATGIPLENEDMSLEILSVHRCLHFCGQLIDHVRTKPKLMSGGSMRLIELSPSYQMATKDNNIEGPRTIVNTTIRGVPQFFVSTNRNAIHGVNRGDGRQLQIAGYLSDESLQRISRDIPRFGRR